MRDVKAGGDMAEKGAYDHPHKDVAALGLHMSGHFPRMGRKRPILSEVVTFARMAFRAPY